MMKISNLILKRKEIVTLFSKPIRIVIKIIKFTIKRSLKKQKQISILSMMN